MQRKIIFKGRKLKIQILSKIATSAVLKDASSHLELKKEKRTNIKIILISLNYEIKSRFIPPENSTVFSLVKINFSKKFIEDAKMN